MNIMLKQLDITLNQYYSPYYDDINNMSYPRHLNNLYKRIQNRFEQIDNLKILLNEDLSDEEFYEIASKTYYFTFKSQKFIKTNIVLKTYNDYLNIVIRVNTKINIDYNKSYTLEEIYNIFKYDSIVYESVFISEYNDISDTSKYIVCNDEEFSAYYNRLRELENIKSTENIKNVRILLIKERIKNDLKRLVRQTECELGYLARKYNDDTSLKLEIDN